MAPICRTSIGMVDWFHRDSVMPERMIKNAGMPLWQLVVGTRKLSTWNELLNHVEPDL